MTYQIIDIDKVIPNTWNPNILEGINFQKLVEALNTDDGNYEQPILVRKHPSIDGKYEIVDGEHRYKAMLKNGFTEIVCKVGEFEDKEARLKTIEMNKFRGDFNSIQLAKLLSSLKNEFGVADSELIGKLGYTQEEIDTFLHLIEFDESSFDTSFDNVKKPEEEPLEEKVGVLMEFTAEEKQYVEQIKELLFMQDLGEALALSARYLGIQAENGGLSSDDIERVNSLIPKFDVVGND